MRHVDKDFPFDVAGYHYQQVTGDCGAGARPGDFKGCVSAVGPMLAYSFTVDENPDQHVRVLDARVQRQEPPRGQCGF